MIPPARIGLVRVIVALAVKLEPITAVAPGTHATLRVPSHQLVSAPRLLKFPLPSCRPAVAGTASHRRLIARALPVANILRRPSPQREIQTPAEWRNWTGNSSGKSRSEERRVGKECRSRWS